jgi:hypothetical protein
MSTAPCVEEALQMSQAAVAEQPVFIVGCGRSGTTLMRLMLSAAGGLMIPPECDFLWRAVRRFGAGATLDAHDIEEFVSLLERISSFPGLDLSIDQIRAELRDKGRAGLPDCIAHVYRTYAARAGRSRWGDKNPFYVLYLDEIRRLYPGVRVIHMIRDGRDVTVSYRTTKMRPYNTFITAKRWVRCIQAGRDWGARHPEQYLEVRYEDLIADPERQLRRVAPFVGERYSDAMLGYYVDNQDMRRIPAHDREHHGNLVKPIIKGNSEKWRAEMSETDRQTFEWVGGRLLADLGYAEPSASPASGVLLYVWLCEVRWRLGRAAPIRQVVERLPWRARTVAKTGLLIDNEHYR